MEMQRFTEIDNWMIFKNGSLKTHFMNLNQAFQKGGIRGWEVWTHVLLKNNK